MQLGHYADHLCLSGAVVKNQQNSISTVTYFYGMHKENLPLLSLIQLPEYWRYSMFLYK